MQIRTTSHFDRSYANAPPAIKRAFLKQAAFLLDNIRHPSLRAKKYDADRWQARVTRDWRFYFRIEDDAYILLDIMPQGDARTRTLLPARRPVSPNLYSLPYPRSTSRSWHFSAARSASFKMYSVLIASL
jgi:hypothetical protein